MISSSLELDEDEEEEDPLLQNPISAKKALSRFRLSF